MPPVVPAEPAHLPQGKLTELGGRSSYQIDGVERMEPFLTSVVSHSDLWMFVSSTGALTAGRVDANQALFPYLTEDRLHRLAGRVGPITLIRSQDQLWQPFDPHPNLDHTRSLAKSLEGDYLVFSETHTELGLGWEMSWAPSACYGWVREVTLTNLGSVPLELELLDGLIDIMPGGLDSHSELLWSNLADAYKRAETGPWGTAAVYNLESLITDRAQPAESLTATLVWSAGLPGSEILLDERALTAFRTGQSYTSPTLSTGRPGSYLLCSRVSIPAGEQLSWMMVAEVGLDHASLKEGLEIAQSSSGRDAVETDLATGHRRWVELLALVDGYSQTGEPVVDAHHLSNVTFNTLRGGMFPYGNRIPVRDLVKFIATRNLEVSATHGSWLTQQGDWSDRTQLLEQARQHQDPDLLRLVAEYLPLTLSRRHGDPSRPWNQFSIRTRTETGEELLSYEGNWRDIFQNWEALGRSFPSFFSAMVFTFVNASTLDGHNPYRVGREGVDWEVPNPDDPWANIGYWGDHQIVYLSRLLEAWENHFPDQILEFLDRPLFVYADVPYQIADYDQLLTDPRDSVSYDWDQAAKIDERVNRLGADGMLVVNQARNEIHRVGLLEKLFVPALAKITALVPDGGIWMYTQRPEWNDANNALAGFGLSLVTLAHLRRYLDQLSNLVERFPEEDLNWSAVMTDWLDRTGQVMSRFLLRWDNQPASLSATSPSRISDTERREWLDAMGQAGSVVRNTLYRDPNLTAQPVSVSALSQWIDQAQAVVDATLARARRPDGLFHSYSLLSFPTDQRAEVQPLPLMLEGQVAAIGAGILSPTQVADLVDLLYRSDLFLPERSSFALYPPRTLPSFVQRNQVPAERVPAELASTQLFTRSDENSLHFRPELINTQVLHQQLADNGHHLELWETITDLYEHTFAHHRFTGRSGSMYGYEGIGSIYWHMVSKLLLAVGEVYQAAQRLSDPETTNRLRAAYHRIRSGHGLAKTPGIWGAFPTDCYSHTPAHSGAQQPGMTGQVKELILARWLELGLVVAEGTLRWKPGLLDPNQLWEDSTAPSTARFSYAGTDIVLCIGEGEDQIEVTDGDGQTTTHRGRQLPPRLGQQLFARDGQIKKIVWK